MTRHYFSACDCCLKEILEKDPPHYTRLELERGGIEHSERNPVALVPYTKTMPRRDLCANCYRRITQTLVQAPESLWLLEGFEVVK